MANETKILYVDDEIVNQYLFKMNSSKYYQVVTASSGDEGLELLENDKEIRLVASDLKMPKMNGLDFIKKAKQVCPELPFFLLTGFDITPEINEAITTKLIVSHLKKPFNFDKMHDAFSKVLQ